MIIRLKVFEQTLSIVDTKSVPRKGSKDYLALHFLFSSDWKDLNKVCYLQHGEVSQPIDVVDGLVEVPEWFTQQDSFDVTLFGKGSTQEVPTNVVSLRLEKSNTLWEQAAPEPQPSWLAKVIDLNNHPPIPGDNGYWLIWDTDKGAYVESELPLPAVSVGPQGPAGPAGAPGKDGTNGVDGITPSIGNNGNWYLGDTDTGKPSRGEKGDEGQPGKDGQDGSPGKDGADGKSAYAYAVEGGYTGTEAEFAEKLAAEKFANPNALTFTGAVTGSYDGSAPVRVEIPSGGGSGGSASLQLLTEGTLTEDTATIYVDGFSADRLAFAVAPYGSTANSGNVNGLFTFGFSDDSSININMNSAFVTNAAAKAWNKHIFYATVNGNVLYILAKKETGIWDTNIDIHILSNFSGSLLKMVLLPQTVKITFLSIGLSSTGVIGANTQFKVVCA